LDYLAYRHCLLFIVSAGNTPDPFPLDTYSDCGEFLNADPIARQIVLLRSLERSKGTRTILSPAEAVNVLTVGAMHLDGSGDCPPGHVEPFAQIGVTNLCSRTGLGINRAIKPDLIEAGGRQIAGSESIGPVVSVWGKEISDIGQLVAAPEIFGGDSSKVLRSTGTSNATALVTRSGIKLADTIERIFVEDGQDWLAQPTRAVIIKALLAHGCAWQATGALLDAIYPPVERKRWARRRETITRFVGFGRIDLSRVLTAEGSRITLLADDVIKHDQLHEYAIPIPRAMTDNREIRRIILTLAWSSPIEPASTRYRGIGLDIVDQDGGRNFWEGVKGATQPHPDAGRRGTLQHLVLEGSKLVRAAGTGAIFVGVQARAAISSFEDSMAPYALAVTLEMAQPVRQDLNADVAARIRPKIRQRVRTQISSRVRN
jgi:hypothetical protein